MYVWSLPVVTLDTVAKNRLSWKACEKCQRVVSGKNKKATSNFILIQGRRRVFKSGPAKEAIECRRHEGGGGSARGGLFPSR